MYSNCVTFIYGIVGVSSIILANDVAQFVYKVEEGCDLKIDCNETETQDLAFVWKKNGSSTFYEHGIELKLPNITRDEAGDYICFSYNLTYETEENATKVAFCTVEVLYRAKITSFSIEPREVLYNHSFTVSCTIEGNPKPNLTIFSNMTGQILYSGVTVGSVIVESPPTRCQDAGFWVCTGWNYFNKRVNTTRVENITVYCPPEPKPYRPYWWKVGARTEENAYLLLENWGFPEPNCTWTKAIGVLPRGHQYDGGTFSILNISDVERNDFGIYWVVMRNSLGSYAARFDLFPNGMPEAPANLTFSDVTDYGVTLNWTSGYDMGSKQRFIVYYLDNYTYQQSTVVVEEGWYRTGGDTYSIIYLNVQPDTNYNLTVGAFNKHGGPVFSNSVAFKTKVRPDFNDSHFKLAAIITGSVVGGLGIISAGIKLIASIKNKKSNSYISIEGENKAKQQDT